MSGEPFSVSTLNPEDSEGASVPLSAGTGFVAGEATASAAPAPIER